MLVNLITGPATGSRLSVNSIPLISRKKTSIFFLLINPSVFMAKAIIGTNGDKNNSVDPAMPTSLNLLK